jgi:2-dehydropantoate 2-reductase
VAPAVVDVAAEMAGPGHVRHLGRGELVIPSDIAGALAPADLVALFGRAGVPVAVSGNVAGELWSKLVLNCAYNAMSAIADLPYGRLVQLDGVKDTMHGAVRECVAVAAAAGVTPAGDVYEAVERIARTMPGQFSSTAQDVRRGKPSEIDHLNGFVAREGRRLGVPTPVNQALWALVKAIESRATFQGGTP